MKYIYVITLTIILTVSAMMFVNASAGDIEVLNSEISNQMIRIDSLQSVNKSLSAINSRLVKDIDNLNVEKDSITKVVVEKEVKVEQVKELRDENSRIVYSAADSSIIRILSKHEFEALQ